MPISNPTSLAPVTGNLLVELHSILEHIQPERLFLRAQPLEVELGSGDGSFLLEYARRHPERNFIGVERLLGRVNKLDRKGRRMGLTNLRGVRIEAGYFLEYLLPPGCATAVHIYFPDPWPKRKHRRFRLVSEQFPAIVRRALMPGGIIYLRTDHVEYFEQMLAVFAADKHFQPVETPTELSEVTTDFERDFNAVGIPTNRAAYRVIA